MQKTRDATPRDVLAMMHLVSRWMQSQGIHELRIEPGAQGSQEARITRYSRVRLPAAIAPAVGPAPKGRGKPRKLTLASAIPSELVEGVTEVLPLTHTGGTSGLREIRLVKRCARCRAKKFIEDFSRQRGSADGRNAYCRKCKVAITRRDATRRAELPDRTIERRLWPRVNKDAPDGCWQWQGPVDRHGYGHISFRGNSSKAVHLVAYELLKGPLTKGKILRHRCGNRACINPEHMIVTSRREISLVLGKDNPFRQNALKVRCHRGHLFNSKNTHHFRVDNATTRVCLECLRQRSPRTLKRPNRRQDAMRPRDAKLLRKASEALRSVSPAIREDARSILTIEILARDVSAATLDARLRKAVRQAWALQPDKWKASSLDEPLFDGDGETRGSRIADDLERTDPAALYEASQDE